MCRVYIPPGVSVVVLGVDDAAPGVRDAVPGVGDTVPGKVLPVCLVYIPPGVGDAVPGAAVGAVLILQPRAHHLVRVGSAGGDQLRYRCEREVLH